MNALTSTAINNLSTNISNGNQTVHHYQDLIRLFNQTFSEKENTVLVKGTDEPIYKPSQKSCQPHQIVFAHGYFASALHEISHWCIAGTERRLLEDYGYWYSPDGRDKKQQSEFEKVEVKPQAIEWIFSCAAGKAFSISVDNLNGETSDPKQFQDAVTKQVIQYLGSNFPARAATFIKVLQDFYQTPFLQQEMFVGEDCYV